MKHKVGIHLVILLVVFIIACKDDQLRKAAKASDDAAIAIGAMIDVKRELGKQELITPAQELVLTERLLDVNRAVYQFNSRARTYDRLDSTTQTELLRLFGDITGSMRTLNEQGVLQIQNPDTKQKLSAVLSALDTAVQTIGAALGGN